MHQIRFTPDLGETVQIPSQPLAEIVQLRFAAHLASKEQLQQLEREGAVLEVWSNLPGFAQDGGWGAKALERPGVPSISEDDAFTTFSTDTVHSEDLALGVVVSVPLKLTSTFKYSYTYRLNFPLTGAVNWLGTTRNNGVFLLQTEDNMASSSPHTFSINSGIPYTWQDERGHGQLLNFGQEHDVWAFTEQGLSTHAADDIRVAFFIPRISATARLVPPIIALRAEDNGPFRTSDIQRPGQPLKTLCLYTDADLQTLLQYVGLRTIQPTESSAPMTVVTFSQENLISVSILPSVPLEGDLRVSITLPDISTHFPHAEHVTVFSPTSRRSKFLSDEERSLSFLTSASGGHFILSPSHPVKTQDEKWEMYIISPHKIVEEAVHPLPTPPASPPPTRNRPQKRPVPHRRSLTSPSALPSVPSISEVGAALRQTLSSESNLSHRRGPSLTIPSVPSISKVSTVLRQTVVRSASDTNATLLSRRKQMPPNPQALTRYYVRWLLTMLTMVFTSLARMLVGSFFAHGESRENGVHLNGDGNSEVSEEEMVSDYSTTPSEEDLLPTSVGASFPSTTTLNTENSAQSAQSITTKVLAGEFALLLRRWTSSALALEDKVQILVEGEMASSKLETLQEHVVYMSVNVVEDGSRTLVRLVDGVFESSSQ